MKFSVLLEGNLKIASALKLIFKAEREFQNFQMFASKII